MLQIPLRKLDELKPQPTDLDHFETANTGELCVWQRDRDVRLADAARLAHIVKNTVGVTARVSVLDPDRIERSAEKGRRLIDQRTRG